LQAVILSCFVGGSNEPDAAENNAETRCSRTRHQLLIYANIYQSKCSF